MPVAGLANKTGKRYVEVRAGDLAANWPGQRRALFELLGVDDFATRSTFQYHILEKRNDQFDRGTREFVERTLDGVIRPWGTLMARRSRVADLFGPGIPPGRRPAACP